MRSPITFSLAALSCLGLLFGCGADPATQTETPTSSPVTPEATIPQQEPLKITVSVLPQQYFVEKIGGDRVQVSTLVGPGIEAENYEPKPQQLKDLSEADAYIGIGIFFEEVWGDRLRSANREMTWLDTAEGIEKLPLADHHHHGDDGHSDSHDHEGELLDPHIWLSPQRVKQQAESIYQLLVQLDPDGETIYADNLNQFLVELDQLDQTIRERLAPLENRTFLVFHPAWGYFAADYDLEQISIEVEGQEPSAAELAQLVQTAKEKQIRTIFVQPQLNAQAAEAIAQEINAEVILLDDLAPNWSENMLAMTDKFVQASRPNPTE
ncbi:metal ABC transporter solute-binding protein, Zn/Mn family [Picosynechococcus sp. PCC 73109]|uniref:metal ABC transporter solute-binding protein, Zn/Mn family n=1 Tax=Picosynechococcus sp. PCC 73109 TaxID=374982 RepID=UPI0007458F3A|nr:zinc ABC transporter substrate-binding protein [Picosynechococcus sp. PCC 73109]AMA10063.1 cation ABC transporter substrate-binding protein [Picosynechococcus sp. PCC 73109]